MTLVVGENFFLMDVLWQWQVVVVFAADVCHIALQFRQYAIVVYLKVAHRLWVYIYYFRIFHCRKEMYFDIGG